MVDRLTSPLNTDGLEKENIFLNENDYEVNGYWAIFKNIAEMTLFSGIVIPKYLWRLYVSYSDFWLWLKY